MSETRELIVALHHDGRGVVHIAAQLGLAQDTVWRVLREAGIARPAHATRAAAKGDNLADPHRADARLRNFNLSDHPAEGDEDGR